MKTIFEIVRTALLIGGAVFLFLNPVHSQNMIELLEGSDQIKLDGNSKNWIVTGNVVFKMGTDKLYCDSAYFNTDKNKVSAYSNVHFSKKDTLNMFCDSLHYDAKKELAKLFGNVRIRNNEYKLTTDSLDYDLKKDVGIYRNNGVITSISSTDQLTSVIGYFYPSSDQFNFRKDVVYSNDDYIITTDTLQFNSASKKAFFFGPTTISGDSVTMYCEKGWYDIENDVGVLENKAYIDRPDLYIAADSLYYNSKDSIYIAKKNVEIIDTTHKIGFTGDYAWSDDVKKETFITGHTLAKRFEKKDTLYIHADTLYNYLDSLNEPTLMLAFHDVKLFRGDMQGVCDSLVYNRKEGEMNMYYDPILWAKNAQLSGDTVTIYEENDEIQKAYLRKNGLIITHVDSTQYYNQVAGTTMTAYFDSTQIRSVDIDGNAKTIYFLEQEEENDSTIVIERKGMNRLFASNITLRFEDGDIETATYRESPDGILFPMNNIDKKEEKVENFKWNDKDRPISWQEMIYSEAEKKILYLLFKLGSPF